MDRMNGFGGKTFFGHYDSVLTFLDNVSLSDAISAAFPTLSTFATREYNVYEEEECFVKLDSVLHSISCEQPHYKRACSIMEMYILKELNGKNKAKE